MQNYVLILEKEKYFTTYFHEVSNFKNINVLCDVGLMSQFEGRTGDHGYNHFGWKKQVQ